MKTPIIKKESSNQLSKTRGSSNLASTLSERDVNNISDFLLKTSKQKSKNKDPLTQTKLPSITQKPQLKKLRKLLQNKRKRSEERLIMPESPLSEDIQEGNFNFSLKTEKEEETEMDQTIKQIKELMKKVKDLEIIEKILQKIKIKRKNQIKTDQVSMPIPVEGTHSQKYSSKAIMM